MLDKIYLVTIRILCLLLLVIASPVLFTFIGIVSMVVCGVAGWSMDVPEYFWRQGTTAFGFVH